MGIPSPYQVKYDKVHLNNAIAMRLRFNVRRLEPS